MSEEQTRRKKISIVTPVFNEVDNIPICYERTKHVFENYLQNYDYEHIFSDNASVDGSVGVLKNLASSNHNIKVIFNARNFGVLPSIWNALMSASGDSIIVAMPADNQDPPEVIPEFVHEWEAGYQVVAGQRKNRGEYGLLGFFRMVYYWILDKFNDFEIPRNVGTFQLIDRQVLDSLREVDDFMPNIRGQIARAGFSKKVVPYDWLRREHGKSHNSFYSLCVEGMNDIISFTGVPLRLALLGGFALSAISILYVVINFIIILFFRPDNIEQGMPTIILALFFFSGVQLFFLGLLGEYIAAIHNQVRKKPMVIEKERMNFGQTS